jgi:hypothetical protein
MRRYDEKTKNLVMPETFHHLYESKKGLIMRVARGNPSHDFPHNMIVSGCGDEVEGQCRGVEARFDVFATPALRTLKPKLYLRLGLICVHQTKKEP